MIRSLSCIGNLYSSGTKWRGTTATHSSAPLFTCGRWPILWIDALNSLYTYIHSKTLIYTRNKQSTRSPLFHLFVGEIGRKVLSRRTATINNAITRQQIGAHRREAGKNTQTWSSINSRRTSNHKAKTKNFSVLCTHTHTHAYTHHTTRKMWPKLCALNCVFLHFRHRQLQHNDVTFYVATNKWRWFNLGPAAKCVSVCIPHYISYSRILQVPCFCYRHCYCCIAFGVNAAKYIANMWHILSIC